MSLEQLDKALTAPKRLAIMAVLANSQTATFAFLKQHLGVSDSDLSKQLSTLVDLDYAEASRTGRGPGSGAHYQSTKTGRAALTSHLAALDRLLRAAAPEGRLGAGVGGVDRVGGVDAAAGSDAAAAPASAVGGADGVTDEAPEG